PIPRRFGSCALLHHPSHFANGPAQLQWFSSQCFYWQKFGSFARDRPTPAPLQPIARRSLAGWRYIGFALVPIGLLLLAAPPTIGAPWPVICAHTPVPAASSAFPGIPSSDRPV